MAYDSISSQEGDFELQLIVGAPSERLEEIRKVLPKGALCVAEADLPGLANKLDNLLQRLDADCDFIGWLGDDDLLTPGSLEASSLALQQNPRASLSFGGCEYIDSRGHVIFTNRSGQWAASILPFGPQLIPQPGSLMRRESYLKTGGLDTDFGLAFDFDLLLKLKRLGTLVFVPKVLARFRWHPTSLSVKQRMRSVTEASRVRRNHYQGFARLVWWLWEPPVIIATWAAGKIVTLRTEKTS
jgi:hypothetical protein